MTSGKPPQHIFACVNVSYLQTRLYDKDSDIPSAENEIIILALQSISYFINCMALSSINPYADAVIEQLATDMLL